MNNIGKKILFFFVIKIQDIYIDLNLYIYIINRATICCPINNVILCAIL